MCALSLHIGPVVEGLVLKEETQTGEQKSTSYKFVLSLILSKASPGAYSPYSINMTCFMLFYCM
jgi:hypothetical protein